MRHETQPGSGSGRWPQVSLVYIILGAAAALFLLVGHRAHVFGVLPYLLLLACPLVHLFMHRGHGGSSGGHH